MPSHAPLFDAKGLQPPAKLSLLAEACPTCDQPIPHDRYDEIKERIQSRERKRADEITARLQEQHARDKEAALEDARKLSDTKIAEALDQARKLSEAKIIEARDAARRAADAENAERIAAVQRESGEVQAAMSAELAAAREATEGAAATIERMKEDAALREQTIRAEAMQAAEAVAQEKLAAGERRLKEVETALNLRIESADAAKVKAETAAATLEAALTKQRDDHAVVLADMESKAVAREAEIRKELEAAAADAVRERIEALEAAKANAEAGAASAASRLEELEKAHQAQLQDEREVWQKHVDAAVNAEKAASFEERLKIQTKFEELKRAYDQKTAEELGEGAEIDLYESLKAEFEGDKIERINKGLPGADILHTVMHNGKECGKIIYDSKNHKQWRSEFVTKLASDQMAAKAEHAVLSTSKFPKGARQLHVLDGVVLAGPARVVALVQVIRRHLVQTHTLRLSNDERVKKTAALYDFITSERCAMILARIDTHTDDLLDLQVKEKKAHDATWKKQGELIRSVQRVRAELANEIDAIVGMADFGDMAADFRTTDFGETVDE
ncbi:DUF2130 domain-containing protein [Bradyrhizobium sp. CCBAU 51765]|uniref:DUF2130 domain-containing protein n=1 Tax=Bradyrhizobium sp. CCBAU 51765 TaxID=1325102 RepID=UPI001888FCD1|nr:DUF2130 domain-containing protein [Bradyrhizobium sp. CCBAU 51765]QOZ06651.1 hypothetical protein XH96_03300 [Bradyrhizobium sp. CCBAU 51765]